MLAREIEASLIKIEMAFVCPQFSAFDRDMQRAAGDRPDIMRRLDLTRKKVASGYDGTGSFDMDVIRKIARGVASWEDKQIDEVFEKFRLDCEKRYVVTGEEEVDTLEEPLAIAA